MLGSNLSLEKNDHVRKGCVDNETINNEDSMVSFPTMLVLEDEGEDENPDNEDKDPVELEDQDADKAIVKKSKTMAYINVFSSFASSVSCKTQNAKPVR